MKLVNWNCFCVELLTCMCTFAIYDYWKSFLWREREREKLLITFRISPSYHLAVDQASIKVRMSRPTKTSWDHCHFATEIADICQNHVTTLPSILWIPPCEHHHHQTIPLHQHRLSNHLSPPIDISIVGIRTNTNYSLWSQISNQTGNCCLFRQTTTIITLITLTVLKYFRLIHLSPIFQSPSPITSSFAYL